MRWEKNLKSVLLFIFICFYAQVGSGQNLPDFVKAKITEYEQLVEKYTGEGNKKEAAKYLNQIAYVYWENNILKEAAGYFEKSLGFNKDIGNKNAIKNIYSNLGYIYSEMNDFPSSLSNFEEGLKISRAQKNKQEIASGLQNTAQVHYDLKQYDEAISDLEEAAALAMEENNMKLMQNCFSLLAENYEKTGNAKMSKDYYEKSAALLSQFQKKQIETVESQKKEAEITAVKNAQQLKNTRDTLNNIKETIEEIRLKASLIEKENQIKDLAIKEQKARNRANRLKLFYAGTALFFMLLLLVLFFFQFQQKKKANKLLLDQKLEIEKQRDLANKQKQKITDSILYAKRIQNAVLPPENLLNESLQDYFILYRPRDIVSGDFYWVTRKENTLVLAAADCTGHGVPGAFMSMLGIAFLNEIVNKIAINKHIRSFQANTILHELRNQVINSLHQNGDRTEQKDGMDIALCIIDFEERKMQFSGAHNSLLFVRNGEIMQYQGDKMPVSFHRNKDIPFTLHQIDLRKGDTFYIFSDGYVDQFGGNEGTKFLQSNFKNMLQKIHSEPMNDQKAFLEKTFDEWKGDREQVDDVMVIGFRYTGKKQQRNSEERFSWEDRKVLIAEDTDVNYFLLVEALRQTKAKLFRVKNGKEAVEFCRENKPDMVLMDINMPEMDGFEATRKIKQIRKEIPVIIQTALYSADEEEEVKASGADDFISKPIDLKTFLNKLEKYLE